MSIFNCICMACRDYVLVITSLFGCSTQVEAWSGAIGWCCNDTSLLLLWCSSWCMVWHLLAWLNGRLGCSEIPEGCRKGKIELFSLGGTACHQGSTSKRSSTVWSSSYHDQHSFPEVPNDLPGMSCVLSLLIRNLFYLLWFDVVYAEIEFLLDDFPPNVTSIPDIDDDSLPSQSSRVWTLLGQVIICYIPWLLSHGIQSSSYCSCIPAYFQGRGKTHGWDSYIANH